MDNITLIDLLNKVWDYDSKDIDMVKRAYNYAEYLHEGQVRQSGEPYIFHPLNVAYILADMHADCDTICAGLLHDTLEDTDATKDDIIRLFNGDVANLVDGVTKISRMNFSSKTEQNLANTRKIIMGMMNDVRIIIIKLADRLHNMRTLQFKSIYKQKENALETMELFVPLAYYIGAYRIKSELEDISFWYLYPSEYEKIESMMYKRKDGDNECLYEMLSNISTILDSRSILHEIKVRTKNIYGIYKGICSSNGGKKIEHIHDLLSLKIMVDNVTNCYTTLGLIHSCYNPVNDRFKDYICNPKTNLYQSLHTTVFGEQDKLVQTQIRTFEMDKIASFGLTAYWDINKGQARDIMQGKLRDSFQFYRSLKEINSMFVDNDDFVRQVKEELLADKIYIYLSNGDIREIPKGSNIIDFACYTGVDDILVGAKVNDAMVPLDYILKNKDRIIVLTDGSIERSHDRWCDRANTIYAKRKLKNV